MEKKIITSSVNETIELAEKLGNTIDKGLIIALEGEIGTGKTMFTKGIGRSLNITDPIISPTFTLLREYNGRLKLNHIDAYRLEGISSDSLTLYDLMDDDAVMVIEWSNYITDAGIVPDITITFEELSETQRLITIKGEFDENFNS